MDGGGPTEQEVEEEHLLGRVLSVQSHVVSGYVGNKSAVFPMQLLGLEVDPINSVQFSNHTGYAAGFAGERLSGAQLATLIGGLEANGLHRGYSHLLTGYIGAVSFLRQIVEVARKLRKASPGLVFVCDPVMGDDDRLYVPEELVSVYRDEVVGLATVLTPNQFEAQLLSGVAIRSLADAGRACDVLHSRGPRVVLLTSCSVEEGGGAPGEGGKLRLIVSSAAAHAAGEGGESGGGGAAVAARRHQIEVPKLAHSFTGTGDLIAGLFLAWSAKGLEPHLAAEKAIGSVQAVLARTVSRMAQRLRASGGVVGEGGAAMALELDLVGSKRLLEEGPISAHATPLSC